MRMRRMMMAKTSAPPLAVSGTFGTPVDNGDPLTGSLTITGGVSPYSVSVYSGTAPPGVTFSVSGSSVIASGNTTTNGSYSWTLRVTSTDGQHADSAQSVTVQDASDPYWSSVVALLHFDGTDGSTTFTDEKGHTFTASGGTEIDTAESKFGGASGKFTITNGGVESSASSDFTLGTGDFTVEFWARWTDGSGGYMFDFAPGDRAAIGIYAGKLFYYDPTTGGYGSLYNGPSESLYRNQWNHIAVARSSGTLRAFLNGVKWGEQTSALDIIGDKVVFGKWFAGSGYDFVGHIDDGRITEGVARYTANFTPPATAFPNS